MKITESQLRNVIKKEIRNFLSEQKSVKELTQDANKIKKELSDLKKELSKSNTETNKAKVAAKEGQLLRVANAIRAARAAEHE